MTEGFNPTSGRHFSAALELARLISAVGIGAGNQVDLAINTMGDLLVLDAAGGGVNCGRATVRRIEFMQECLKIHAEPEVAGNG